MTDLRFAIRTFSKSPGIMAAAVLALALGIGANSAIFSVINAVLLRPLPFRQPDGLVMVWERIVNFGQALTPIPAADYVDFRDQNQVFESLAAFQNHSFNLAGSTEPQRIRAARVTHALWPMLGVAPAKGRVFTAEEDQRGRGRVAVASFGLWQRRFGGDPNFIGRTISLDNQPYTLIGVMPPEFQFPLPGARGDTEPAELWVPFALTSEEIANRGDNFNTHVLARLKPGVTMERANADVHRVSQFIFNEYYPARLRGSFELTAAVTGLREEVVGKVREALWILLGAVGFVLLIGCANVANLLLAKAAGRAREVAIRSALGAGRWRLIRQLLTESVMLAVAGGTLGLLLALWGADVLISFSPGNIPRLEQTRLDYFVLGFTLVVSVGTGLLFGLAPAFEASRVDLSTALKEGGRGLSRRSRLRGALVVAEVALSLVLLVGAGLLTKSFLKASGADAGLDRRNLVVMSTALPQVKYSTATAVSDFYSRLLERVTGLPGVESAGLGTSLPMVGSWIIMFTPEGQISPTWGRTLAKNTIVSGDYFRALGIPLKRGRLFTAADVEGRERVVLINETMARRFWPGQDVIGKRLKWGSPSNPDPWLTIAGVVGDVKQDALDAPVEPHVYMAYRQQAPELIATAARNLSLAVRTGTDPASLVASIRRQVAALDPGLPLYGVRTMEQLLNASVAPRRFQMALVGVFAALALVLAAIGIYGVMSYSVQQHTQEIGIRMALGAHAADVLLLVLRQGMTLVVIGLAAGAAGALAVTRLLKSLLYGVSASDPAVFTGVALLLAAIALAACWAPARRATRVDPLVALRYE